MHVRGEYKPNTWKSEKDLNLLVVQLNKRFFACLCHFTKKSWQSKIDAISMLNVQVFCYCAVVSPLLPHNDPSTFRVKRDLY